MQAYPKTEMAKIIEEGWSKKLFLLLWLNSLCRYLTNLLVSAYYYFISIVIIIVNSSSLLQFFEVHFYYCKKIKNKNKHNPLTSWPKVMAIFWHFVFSSFLISFLFITLTFILSLTWAISNFFGSNLMLTKEWIVAKMKFTWQQNKSST